MRNVAALSACLLTLLAGGAGRAGGYLGAGIGPGASVGGDLAQHFTGDGHASGRLLIGHGIGPVALEASLFGTDLSGLSALTTLRDDYSTASLAVDLRLNVPIAHSLDLTLRAGLSKTWLIASNGDNPLDYSGRGHQVGIGLAYQLSPVPLLHAALFAEYTRQTLELRDPARPTLDGDLGMVTVGVTIGAL